MLCVYVCMCVYIYIYMISFLNMYAYLSWERANHESLLAMVLLVPCWCPAAVFSRGRWVRWVRRRRNISPPRPLGGLPPGAKAQTNKKTS